MTVLSGLAKRRPLILCIEDAENLDADSISVLDALVAQLDTLQLCAPGYRCHRLRGAVCFSAVRVKINSMATICFFCFCALRL